MKKMVIKKGQFAGLDADRKTYYDMLEAVYEPIAAETGVPARDIQRCVDHIHYVRRLHAEHEIASGSPIGKVNAVFDDWFDLVPAE